jgi:uncharacterized RDD family membrane protein YckC
MNNYPYPLANPRHRLGGYAVDIAIALVTGFLPWLIWALIVMGQGQTPGKQLVNLRVYDSTTGLPVKWGHMFIRQLGVFIAVWMFQILVTIGVSLIAGYLSVPVFLALGLSSISLIFWLTDILWILKDGKAHRLTDILLKTDVLNVSPAR